MLSFFNVSRFFKIFSVLLSFYLIIKNRPSLLFFKPLSPLKLQQTIKQLGTTFIKFAQVLATRSDFFDESYIKALNTLHDQLQPMSNGQLETILSQWNHYKTLHKFNPKPFACASIGQVHEGWINSTTKVAIKIRQEGIENQVNTDICIIEFFQILFKPLFSYETKNSLESVIEQFSATIKEELSFKHELKNLKEFSIIYKKSGIIFPKPYEKFCQDNILVMSYEEGFRFDDKENILACNRIDFTTIMQTLIQFYTDQMLVKGYYHADPHPGNLLVNQKGELILLDFGMVKRVPNEKRLAIIRLIQAANEQNYSAYIKANKSLGIISYEANEEELIEFTSKMFDIFSNDALNSKSMQKLAFEVLDSTKKFSFKLPSHAVYILRVSSIIEGLGTTYIENFNGVKDILPVLKENLPKALEMEENIADLIESKIKTIPSNLKKLDEILKKLSQESIAVHQEKEQLDYLLRQLKGSVKYHLISFWILASAFFIVMYDSGLIIISGILFTASLIRTLYH